MSATVPLSRIPRFVTQVLSVVLVLAFLAASLPQPALAAQVNCAKKYTVVSGDTLSKIAFDNNITVQELATANDLKDPYTLFIGQELCIPGTTTTTTTGTTTTGTTSTTTSNSKDPNMALAVEANTLTITTANFPTQSNFYIKAGEGRYKTQSWYKLGRLHTKKTGAVIASYKLPKQLRNVRYLNVCVKNAISDAVLCRQLVIAAK